jgi:hypothetical protein
MNKKNYHHCENQRNHLQQKRRHEFSATSLPELKESIKKSMKEPMKKSMKK